jgi:hypothetical protein
MNNAREAKADSADGDEHQGVAGVTMTRRGLFRSTLAAASRPHLSLRRRRASLASCVQTIWFAYPSPSMELRIVSKYAPT